MSFEIIDNTFQVIVLAAMALLAFILAFRRSSRSCLILAFGYASFMMGTLYYLLHLIILGHGPQVFYVAECSWMASYFFFLSLEILYWEGLRPPFSPFALAAGVVFAGVVMRVQVFGPSPLMSGALALTFGTLAYLCFSALQEEILKLLPLLLYFLIFEPDSHKLTPAAIGIAVGFATFENVCYLTENGAGSFVFLLIRGMSAGALHLVCGILTGLALAYVFRRPWLTCTGTVGILGVCMVLHGIYNLLITADGFWQMVGYFFPSAIIVTLFAARLLHRGRHTVFH